MLRTLESFPIVEGCKKKEKIKQNERNGDMLH